MKQINAFALNGNGGLLIKNKNKLPESWVIEDNGLHFQSLYNALQCHSINDFLFLVEFS